MKITKLELKNFKRFDDLTIDMTALEEAPKLVLLIGTNGSGKSSVFDAFELINKLSRGQGGWIPTYHNKRLGVPYKISFKNASNDEFDYESYDGPQIKNNSFYGRTSIRQVPTLTRRNLGEGYFSFIDDSDRSNTFIERDNRFENDIEKVTSLILSAVFNDNVPTDTIKQTYVNPINKAFENIFGSNKPFKLELISIKPPLEGNTAEILFKKGVSTIPYNYLSSGEKEIFNILLNLLTRREYFQDTIYFLDEIDLHLNTQLQKNLLKEITENWIPDNCQLWTASHSLGFIDYANETPNAAIIDLDSLDFDIPQVIVPSPKNKFDVFEIAVSKEFLSNVFEGKRIIFSENTDTPLYNNLKLDDIVFFNAKDKLDAFHKTKNNPGYNGLIDRDYLTDDEREDLTERYTGLNILEYYSSENYLYHPDNLEEYYQSIGKPFDKDGYKEALITEKNQIRDKILMGIGRARDGYPFYRENENQNRLKTFKGNDQSILNMFDSHDFETFYKVFPAKDYGGNIEARRNLSRGTLAQTQWFKSKIQAILIK